MTLLLKQFIQVLKNYYPVNMGKEYESDLCSLRLRSLLEDKGNLDLENIMSKLSINKYSYQRSSREAS